MHHQTFSTVTYRRSTYTKQPLPSRLISYNCICALLYCTLHIPMYILVKLYFINDVGLKWIIQGKKLYHTLVQKRIIIPFTYILYVYTEIHIMYIGCDCWYADIHYISTFRLLYYSFYTLIFIITILHIYLSIL